MTAPDPQTLDIWTQRVCEELGLSGDDIATNAILLLTRNVAHGVARPAAPLSTFLIGLAVGRDVAAGGSVETSAASAIETVNRMVDQWIAEHPSTDADGA